MASLKVPGLGDEGDEDSDARNKPATHKYFLAIGVSPLSVKLIEAPFDTPNERLSYNNTSALYVFTEEEYQQLGVPSADEKTESDDCILCDLCNRYYSGCCKEHPLFWFPDWSKTSQIAGGEEIAKKSAPVFIQIRMSRISKAGLGAFAAIHIPRGFVFGPYEGVLIEDADLAKVDGYCWEIWSKDKTVFVDGSDPRYSNWMRFVNHSDVEDEQNVVAFQYQGSVYYRISRPVKRGEEILMYYGANYAAELQKDSESRRKKTYSAPKTVRRRKYGKHPFIL